MVHNRSNEQEATMSKRDRFFTTGLTSFMVLALCGATSAQIVRVERSDRREMAASDLEAAVYLQWYAHPQTARREIDALLRRGRLELRGTVATEQERELAERLAVMVADEVRIANRLRVGPVRGPEPALRLGRLSAREVVDRFREQLRDEFPPELVEDLTLRVYPVPLSAEPAPAPPGEDPPSVSESAWVAVLEGTVPSVDDQIAMSALLVTGEPAAAAVVNRTYSLAAARGEARRVNVRVPFFRLNLDIDDRGVDLGMRTLGGPLHVRTAEREDRRADRRVSDRYLDALRDDRYLKDVPVRFRVLRRIITLEGDLTPADQMRAVRLALETRGAYGVVDDTQLVDGGPAFYELDDVRTFVSYRLGEDAAALDVELDPRTTEPLRGTVIAPTAFHSTLAATVREHDPTLRRLPLELEIREATPRPARERRD